jgi:hypothetical protein
MSKSAEKQRVYNLRFDVGPAAEVVTSCRLKIPSLPTDTVLSQTSSPLSQVMSQLVWDNIFGTTSQGFCCQGLGPLHGTDSGFHLPQSEVPRRLPTERDLEEGEIGWTSDKQKA